MNRKPWLIRLTFGMMLFISTWCWAFDLDRLIGSGGDSGSGKVAKLEFSLKEDFFPTAIAWSPDGRFIASSGTHTRSIHIWDVAQRQLAKQLELSTPPSAHFHNMAWSPDGRYLAICGTFGSSLRIYATKDWSVERDFGPDQAGGCQAPLFSSDGKEMTLWAHSLTTFSVGDWHITRRLKGTTVLKEGNILKPQRDGWNLDMQIRDASYVSKTSQLVFAGGRYEHEEVLSCNPPKASYTSRLWMLNAQEQAVERSVVVHCKYIGGATDVEHVAVSPDQVHAAVAVWQRDNRRVVHVVNLVDGTVVWTPVYPAPNQEIPEAITYTPNGKYLLIGMDYGRHEPGTVIVADPSRKQVIDSVKARGTAVLDIAVDPSGSKFAAAAETYITVWSLISK